MVWEELRQRGIDMSLDDVQKVVDDQVDHYAPGILEIGAAYGYDAAKNIATILPLLFGAPVATGVSAEVAAIAIPSTRVASEVAKGAELIVTAAEDMSNSNYGTAAIKVATIPIAFYAGRGVTAATTKLLEKGGEKLITEAVKEGFEPIIEEVAGASGRLIPRVATGPLLVEEMKQLMIDVTSKVIAHKGIPGAVTEISERVLGETSKRGTKFASGVIVGIVADYGGRLEDNEEGLAESFGAQTTEQCNPSKQNCVTSVYEYNPLTGEETYTYNPPSGCDVQSGGCTPLEMTYDSEGELLSYSLNGEILTYSPDGEIQVKSVQAKPECGALDFNCRLREMVDSNGKEKPGKICG